MAINTLFGSYRGALIAPTDCISAAHQSREYMVARRVRTPLFRCQNGRQRTLAPFVAGVGWSVANA